jgi:hypothetical protein
MERGLSPDSVRNYLPFVHRFLAERFMPPRSASSSERHAARASSVTARISKDPADALGDVRLSSVKRVAAAVGEGSMVIVGPENAITVKSLRNRERLPR